MAARRSGLHIRQSPCSLLPCQRLPDRIQEASYHRRMKMSEFWRSWSVSCGTSVFGFLRESSQQFWVPEHHIAPFLGVVKTAFSRKRFGRDRPSFPPSLADSKQHYRTVFEMPREKKILSATHDRSQRPDPVKYADDSVWPNLYLSMIAPTPTRSTWLSETFSTRTAPARPLIYAWVPSVTPQAGMMENQNLIPTR